MTTPVSNHIFGSGVQCHLDACVEAIDTVGETLLLETYSIYG
jgi:hypothetical protein